MPLSEDALYNGEIGIQHLATMAKTARAVGKEFDEKRLLPLAKKHSPGKFYHESLHYRHSVRPQEVASEQADLAENRALSMSTAEDGCVILQGVLDPVGGAALRTALEPLAKPMGKFDYRERPQRLADALVELATAGGKVAVQMQVTSSIETLLGLLGAPGAETEFSLPVSSKTVERWACDSSITRVLMQDSVAIDVGRSKRTIRGPRRRADRSRQALPVAGLRAASLLVRRSSPGALDPRGRDQSRQPDPALGPVAELEGSGDNIDDLSSRSRHSRR